MRQILNGQLPLEKAAKLLSQTVHSIIKTIEEDVGNSSRRYPRSAQAFAFNNLRFNVSFEALERVAQEWWKMSEVIANRIEITDLILGPCEDCGILNQFLLPCCHYLVRAYTTGEMIPRSLIHPR